MNNITKYNNKLNILGNTIKEYRIKNNLSLSQLSNKLMLVVIDIPKSSLQRIEVGQRVIKDYELIGFLKVFNLTPNTLLTEFISALN